MKGARFFLLCLLVILGITAGMAPTGRVMGQSAEEFELLAEINALRASRGLAPYTVDPGLMAMAHEHSVYQATIHQSTHQHSDGQDPPDLGVVENVAGGDVGYLTPRTAIYDIWVMDAVHLKTLVGFASGCMGVGIADDGITVFYTLEVRSGSACAATGDSNGSDPGSAGGTPIAYTFVPLVTMTPLPDGSIIHVVESGQTLWSIAITYGVTIDQIKAWNNLPQDSNEIYVGQKLLVRLAGKVTAIPAAATDTPAPFAAAVNAESPQPTASAVPTGTLVTTRSGEETGQAAESGESGEPDASEDPGSMASPIIAGASILLGSALLILILLRRRTG